MTQGLQKLPGKPIELVHVLVAEDNPLNQELVRCYFEQIGCSVDLAEDGIEAIRLFQLNRYDVVFLDCQMPKMDGLGAARKIREFERLRGLRNFVPIIALTANSEEADREDCLSAGMNEWLTKPFTVDQLSSTLEQWLGADGAVAGTVKAVDGKNPAVKSGTADLAKGSVDIATIDAIRTLETSENRHIFSDIVDTYIASAAELLDRLAPAAERGDAREMAAVAHLLKTSSANVGAIILSDVCRELEKRTREGDLSGTSGLCNRVSAEFDAVRQLLEAEVRRH